MLRDLLCSIMTGVSNDEFCVGTGLKGQVLDVLTTNDKHVW